MGTERSGIKPERGDIGRNDEGIEGHRDIYPDGWIGGGGGTGPYVWPEPGP